MPDAVRVASEAAQTAVESWPLVEAVLATGAVGTAAFGIVDAAKLTPLGLMGFGRIRRSLGPALMGAVERAYGTGADTVLQGYYRDGRGRGPLGKALRQGVRVGLRSENARELAEAVGSAVSADRLAEAVGQLEAGVALADEQRSVVGRFELAVDARIDAALALAESSYVGWMRVAASVVAIVLALLGTQAVAGLAGNWDLALVIGIAAVPLAPIAKDVASGLRSARSAARAGARVRT